MGRSKPIIATNLQTGEETVYVSIRQAARKLGMHDTYVWKVINNQLNQTHGYTFRYAKAGEVPTVKQMLTQLDAEIIVAMADSGLNASHVAKRVYVCRNSVHYRIGLIKERTGKDPRNFYDLCELLPMAKAVLEGE